MICIPSKLSLEAFLKCLDSITAKIFFFSSSNKNLKSKAINHLYIHFRRPIFDKFYYYFSRLCKLVFVENSEYWYQQGKHLCVYKLFIYVYVHMFIEMQSSLRNLALFSYKIFKVYYRVYYFHTYYLCPLFMRNTKSPLIILNYLISTKKLLKLNKTIDKTVLFSNNLCQSLILLHLLKIICIPVNFKDQIMTNEDTIAHFKRTAPVKDTSLSPYHHNHIYK